MALETLYGFAHCFHLHENLRFLGVYAGCQVSRGGVEHSDLELLGVLRHCDSVEVHHEKEVLELVLPIDVSINTSRRSHT